ncbi:alpha-keto acid decarboxylase family protein [Aspergillus affinis]|uniref:alpha-keto acid decarboxylase family protein n=1 Tax=Aspergillus affinis TaxID=1070780 RepID=UPI0022FDC147|nr:thiamine diphosphate-binding protein [Aspergillus affinis]KAI9035298.1 thiamine diphosphate-binding protein [Aspergillus affinis]
MEFGRIPEKPKSALPQGTYLLPASEQICVAEYIYYRLRQLGVCSIHGVPGDFNLAALDYVEATGLHWVGNSNELNAGYAADGYARIKGLSALMTTGGVGELSALNAIAGGYAEKVPIVHIVGTPPTHLQDQNANLHHSLGDGNLRLYASIYRNFTCAQANLRDPTQVPRLVDDTLRQCLLHNRPVYIELPADMVKVSVSASRLKTAIDFSLPPSESRGREQQAVKGFVQAVLSALQPLIILDGWVSQYGFEQEADELVRLSGFPTATTPFGKGKVNESYSNFCGVYAGAAGSPEFLKWVANCDLVIRLAPLDADTNTYGFTTLTNRSVTIEIHQSEISIRGAVYSEVNVKSVLHEVLSQLVELGPAMLAYNGSCIDLKKLNLTALPDTPADTACITQDMFWRFISRLFRPGDTIIAETGTTYAGCCDFALPPKTTIINSALWLSIGYALGASGGAALAQREMIEQGVRMEGRTILFEGDGSFQMTVQAISDIIRNRLDLIMFIVNNNGYTIERYINGMEAHYNDIQPWRYLDTPWYFGAAENTTEYPVFTKQVKTWGDLERVLEDNHVKDGKGLIMVEVILDKEDAHPLLKQQMELVCRQNKAR